MGTLLRECRDGWIIVMGRFISGFIEVGTVKSFGVLLPDMVTQLEATSGKIGLAFGLCHGLTFGLGPLTSALYRYTQSRLVMVFGTIVATLSISLASLANDANQLVTALIFTGLGYSLMCLPTIMALNKHFVNRFALAYGIAQTGPAVGMIVLPVVTEHLAEGFGWKGALLLLGAMNFHMMITAVVTREPEQKRSGQGEDSGANDIEKKPFPRWEDLNDVKEVNHLSAGKVLNGDIKQLPSAHISKTRYGSCVNLSTDRSKQSLRKSFLMRKFKSCDEEDTGILSADEMSMEDGYMTPSLHDQIVRNTVSDGDMIKSNIDHRNKTDRQHNRKSYHSYQFDAINCNDKQPLCSNSRGKYYGDEHWAYDLRKLSHVSEELELPDHSEGPKKSDDKSPPFARIFGIFKAAVMSFIRFLDLELMRDAPALVILQLSFILLTSVHVGWMIFLVPHAVAKGIPLQSAVFLSSVGGVGNLIGRIVQGPIVDRRWLTGVQLSIFLSIINAITLAIDPLLKTLPVLCVDAFFSGLCSGALIPLVAICVKEVVPRDRFANAVGLVSLSYGFGEPLGGYIAGKLADSTDSYERVFIVFGGLEFVKVLLLIVVAIMSWRQSRVSGS